MLVWFLLENIAETGIIEQLFLPSKIDMSETLSLLHHEQICLWYMESSLCTRISLGTSCHTVRDGAGDFGESQRKKLSREINKVVQGSEYNLLYINFIW